MLNGYYNKEYLNNLKKLKELAPDQLGAFVEFEKAVFQDGALTKKEKEIIAVAITHVTECPYCIDFHTRSAKKEGASLEELVEAAFVTASIEAGGAVTHLTHMENANNPEAEDTLYTRSNLQHLNKLRKYTEDGYQAYSNFSEAAVKEGKLSAKFKEIIAVAVSHAAQSAYCIDHHTKEAIIKGATNEELAEAVMVSSTLLAGGAYAHIANMIQSFNE